MRLVSFGDPGSEQAGVVREDHVIPLHALHPSWAGGLKSFLSRQHDRARMAYGRITRDVPRQCVIIGTTNSDRYLRDGTGNRRFWPVRVGEFDVVGLRRYRDQIWAEAAHREAQGEIIRLDADLYPAAAEQQEQRRIEDPFLGRLMAVLCDLEGKLSAEDAWKIVEVPPGQRTQDHNARLGEAMRELGWTRKRLRSAGIPQYCYMRGNSENWLKVHVSESGDVRVHPEAF